MTYISRCLDGRKPHSVNSARAFMKASFFRTRQPLHLTSAQAGHRLLCCSFVSAAIDQSPVTIAVIPRTSGSLLWEPEHRGAQDAAQGIGAKIYWNAPTREDDIAGQIALIEHVARGNYQGLVLTPNQSLALITPVRRALARGLPIVIVSSPIPVPAGDKLSYILNDEEEGGRIAARRVAHLLHGRARLPSSASIPI